MSRPLSNMTGLYISKYSETIVAQRDYVRRGQTARSRRNKKSTSRKNTRNTSSANPVLVAIAVALLVAFGGGLWFLTHHKKGETPTLSSKATGNGLPPKPEERWRYIKELENRQTSIAQPTEPSADGEIKKQAQLTAEQRQLLEQMQADVRQQPAKLSEVPWNEQANARLAQENRPTSQTVHQPPSYPPLPHTASQPPKTSVSQPRNETTKITPPAPTEKSKTETAPVNHTQEQVKRVEEKKDERSWMVQCGSFKNIEQAETVRAQLTFEGFDSHITTNNGWNRVIIGPFKGKDKTDSTLSRLKTSGHGQCIRLAAGG